MADQRKLYLFGDQTHDIKPQLKRLLQNRSAPVVEDFLTRAYDGIRTEIYDLPHETRESLPRFTSLDDLVQWDVGATGEGRCVALDMAVTCMSQLGTFISEADGWYNGANTSRVAGLCTGTLAAAAVSCSRSTQELVAKGLDAVVVAFRTGVRVTDVAKRVAPAAAESGDETWSIIVAGAAAADAVKAFGENSILPLTSRPYVSAFAPNGVTVSGSPAALARLTKSEEFKSFKFKSIPIHGPYHAPHLYSKTDVSDIIEAVVSDSRSQDTEQTTFIPSTASQGDEETKKRTFVTLLEAAVEHILLQPIRWNDILDELQAWLQTAGDSESFRVVPIGTLADQVVYSSLKQTSLRSLLPSAEGPGIKSSSGPGVNANATAADPKRPKLAIIAMSGRFPGAESTEAFWDLLHQGLDVHKPVPALHWDAKTHVDPTGSTKNTSATPFGCWLDNPAAFDARFFSISPREAPQIDPAQRLALMTAYEAIEQAGIVPDATPSTRRDRVGVFYGVTSNDWMETNSAQNIDTYFIPGGNRAFIPGRINYCFKFSGPSYAVDTACSSSLAGIHLACNSLWQGDIDTAIAGGTNVLTNPDFTAGLDRGHFLSRTGNCKTFDDGADGYCRGEGIGTIIIKRLDDAIADKDPILGLILGAYTNHSAESESITRPHSGAQRAIFRKILNQAAVDPYTVSYVEMHGTGTQAGDAGEMSSVLDTFAPPLAQVKKGRTTEQPLYLGSAKANIGHGEAASGVSSLIKVLLMMQKNQLVPHVGIKTRINRKFPTDLAERNVNIALAPTAWERSDEPRRVFVNNFSAAGGNTALLIEDAPASQGVVSDSASDSASDPRSHHVVAVSAKNGVSLQGNLRSLIRFLQENATTTPLGQLSYTTTARRQHHQHRVMVAGTSIDEIRTRLETALKDNAGMTRPKSAPKVVFTYTGQGAQYPGMGRELYTHLSAFRTEIRRLDQIGQSLGFPSVVPVIVEAAEADIGAFSPLVVQLANVCLQIALTKLWASWNVRPTAVAGHSLGEYAALNAAGVLSDTDAIYLVGKRAELLQAKCTKDTHSMLVVKGSVPEIEGWLGVGSEDKFKYEFACINSPVETVLAGANEDIASIKTALTDAGVKSTLLKVPYAMHSAQLDPILADFEHLAGGVTFSAPRLPVLCPLDGSVVAAGEELKFGPQYLAQHSRQSVNMLQALQTARTKGVIADLTTVLEVGPHPAISGMVKAVLGTQTPTLASAQRGRAAFQSLADALKALYNAGADVRWAEFHRDFSASHRVLPLPAYSWDLKEYWMQYVNDWSLRKGDPPLIINGGNRLESTTIHRVVEETGDGQRKTKIVVEADIARKDLSPLVQGHEVDGIPLCTPSVYADMALTLGTYLLRRYKPEIKADESLVDVADMTIFKALILNAAKSEQLLQAHADVDWEKMEAAMKFMTFDSKGKLQEHAKCVLRFKDRSLQPALQKTVSDVLAKMRGLREGIAEGTTARYNAPMVYRAIRPLARFHDDYRAIDEIVLNSNTLEAMSKLSYGAVKRGGDYHTHPAIIDSLTQCCGFAMNCNDYTDLDTEVFMNHGWGSFQIFEPIDLEKHYTTYTQMSEGTDKLWHGDVVVLDGEKVVAYFGSIAIQGVPRRVLGVILALESKAKGGPKQAPAKAAVTQPTRPTASAAAVAAPTVASSSPSQLSKALAIIADESGLAVSDLTEGTSFADVGIDSLLGLTISARLKEEMDLDIEFNAFLFDYPTVGHLKSFLGETTSSGATSSSRRSSVSIVTGASSPRTQATGVTTPRSTDEEELLLGKVDFSQALRIISEESGVAIEELTEDTNFADAGVDSLLSLVIVSRFRDELELDIQHESLFLDCPTVADLRELLAGPSPAEVAPSAAEVAVAEEVSDLRLDSAPAPAPPSTVVEEQNNAASEEYVRKHTDPVVLAARQKAVDELVAKYTAGFTAPTSTPSGTPASPNAKVVLVTGASGSLGGNLVKAIAQLPDVATVICLNRENRSAPDATARQFKAMREKGVHFPDELSDKLIAFQSDTAKPNLGLSQADYDQLAGSVTHLIHNAWPMSAKRALPGFESQFQVMRNLVDFARDAASLRPADFVFSFQMVSSIGVVGHYGLGNGEQRTMVPEDRARVDSVLPNGYSEAKWGCERMLDETLHKYSTSGAANTADARFRTMVVRLGQIAGNNGSGYWNPMEHFGFLIKSSQTLNALPNVGGNVFWTPVNNIALSLADLVLGEHAPFPVYHIENPVGQDWKEVNAILADALKPSPIPLIPFNDWLERVRAAPAHNNPAATLLEFLDSNYLRMSCGGLVLDVKHTLEHSAALRAVGPVSETVVRKYVWIWREIGFLRQVV
ncbi:ketoacyl-synt-domain-containing protein [Dichotomopilus funicola]|uniref:Ketoacyl-synt-domain-containing protein n=1 Tax=Dichotomopilus funicola TaxID=1934379 RepID=A0AAN6ZQ54_9PEZI|nr:ketoacyl-synt-domain-containing protein [Dichotomopilus funicola]